MSNFFKSIYLKLAMGLTIGFTVIFTSPVLIFAQSSFETSDSAASGVGFAISMFILLFFSFLYFALICCLPLVLVIGFIYNVFLVIDATERDFGEDQNLLILWIVILLVVGFPVGTLLYYFLVMKNYPKKVLKNKN